MAATASDASLMLWLRFSGKDLGARSIPIAELAESLQAIQVILTQAHLHSTRRQGQTVLRRAAERRTIALQLEERRRESDAYGLVPLIVSPVVSGLIVEAIKALTVYTSRRIKELVQERSNATLPDSPSPKASQRDTAAAGVLDRSAPLETTAPEQGSWDGTSDALFLASIYSPVMTLARRVNPYGGVHRLEVLTSDQNLPPATFDQDVRKDIKALGGEVYLGPSRSEIGVVKTLFYERNLAILERQGDHDLRVRLSAEQFDELRRLARGVALVFEGRPRYKLGAKTPRVRELLVSGWKRLQ